MLLEHINSPADVKAIASDQLPTLADEMRNAILARVSLHGGHVGPNLGFVEATIALHRAFNAPTDKFVFDVSHQSYPHKLLTGQAFGFSARHASTRSPATAALQSRPNMILSSSTIRQLP